MESEELLSLLMERELSTSELCIKSLEDLCSHNTRDLAHLYDDYQNTSDKSIQLRLRRWEQLGPHILLYAFNSLKSYSQKGIRWRYNIAVDVHSALSSRRNRAGYMSDDFVSNAALSGLTITGSIGSATTIRGTVAADDSVSTSLKSSSAIAKAAAINDSSSATGVHAIVEKTSLVGIQSVEGNELDETNFLILNGKKISGFVVKDNDASSALVDAINTVSDDTGVVAKCFGELTLTAADGRNIAVDFSTGTLARKLGDFTNVSIANHIDFGSTKSFVATAKITLQSDGLFEMQGDSTQIGFKNTGVFPPNGAIHTSIKSYIQTTSKHLAINKDLSESRPAGIKKSIPIDHPESDSDNSTIPVDQINLDPKSRFVSDHQVRSSVEFKDVQSQMDRKFLFRVLFKRAYKDWPVTENTFLDLSAMFFWYEEGSYANLHTYLTKGVSFTDLKDKISGILQLCQLNFEIFNHRSSTHQYYKGEGDQVIRGRVRRSLKLLQYYEKQLGIPSRFFSVLYTQLKRNNNSTLLIELNNIILDPSIVTSSSTAFKLRKKIREILKKVRSSTNLSQIEDNLVDDFNKWSERLNWNFDGLTDHRGHLILKEVVQRLWTDSIIIFEAKHY